jgi:hypothetical protein
MLKDALVKAPIPIKPNFTKLFMLDIDWSIRGTNVIIFHRRKAKLKE